MVLEALVSALAYFTDLSFLLWVMAGSMVGLILGIIPGVGSLHAIILFLPFVFLLPVEHSIPFMLAAMSMSANGGSITAVLMGVPGTPINTATILDGFPMTQKGEGGRAVGAALVCSAGGGVISVILALGMVIVLLPIILAITNAEMVFIILVGLAFIATLSRGSMTKGLISATLGMLVAFIGYQPVTGLWRFTFGIPYLYDGLPIVCVTMGLFGLPIIIDLATKRGTIATAGTTTVGMADVWQGAKDVFCHWWLFLRSSVIGYVVGVIPGIGGETAIWVAYGHAKQTSKYPEKFGTGVIEGVIGPESANCGREGGAALTTMALGLPGSVVMAVILGGLLIAGLNPGPQMLRDDLPLTLSFLLVIAASNVFGTSIVLPLVSYVAKIASVPSRILVPLLITIIFVGIFIYAERVADLVVMLIFTAVGLAMVKFDFNRVPFLIAYVLGFRFEHFFFMSIGLHGPLFFTRPISLALIFLFIMAVFYGPISKVIKRWFQRGVKPQ
ncbi:tripartite tricarboxylate transporter permease [Chloroflexota bacterium]